MNRKLGAVPLLGGAATPSNTTSPGPRFTSVPSGILIHPLLQPFGHNRHGPKIGCGMSPFSGGAGYPMDTKSPGPRPISPYQAELVHPAAFGHNGHWLKIGGCSLLGEGDGFPSNTMSPRLRLTSVPSGILIHLFGHNRHNRRHMGRKLRVPHPLCGRELGPPSNTKSHGLRPIPPYQMAS